MSERKRIGWKVTRLAAELEAELDRATRDGIPFDQEVEGAELALAGYLAGIREALRIVRGET